MTAEMMTIQVDGDSEKDISTYGMTLVSSPQAFGGEVKSSNIVKIDFPEEDGDVVYIPDVVKVVSFEYKVRLAFKQTASDNPATKILEFMDDVLGKKVIVKNKYKGVKIEGYPVKYSDVAFYQDKLVATFDLTIYVPSGKSEAL